MAKEIVKKSEKVTELKPRTAKKTDSASTSKSTTAVKKTTPVSKKTTTKKTKDVVEESTKKPKGAGKDLIIVESPNKVKTISRIVGNKYNVMASAGHIMKIADKGYKNLGISVADGTFDISYDKIPTKTDIIRNLKLSVQDANIVYLASDLDREGELIAKTLRDALKLKRGGYKRITFNEITEKAILEALNNPRDIDEQLVDAAESRGIEDKVIGYLLSGIARRNVGAPSVGRVQSASLIIVCERENDINKFTPRRYFEIFIQILKDGKTFLAKYVGTIDKKNVDLTDAEIVASIIESCKLNDEYFVKEKKTSPKKISPPKPLITTSMQTEASSKLGMDPSDTMSLAQQLFEGPNVQGITHGLITYIRTDKAEYSEEFGKSAEAFIINRFGKDYLGDNKGIKAKKVEGAQEAHEGIHPTDLSITPEFLRTKVPNDLYRLYKMIYDRSIASYMKEKELAVTTIIVNNLKNLFKYNYSELVFDGFTRMYEIVKDEEDDDVEIVDRLNLVVGDKVDVKDIYSVQKETQPPKRFSEAGLIKKLESSGIGRPSTYSLTMKTLKDREYIEINQRSIRPTILGMKLYDFLKENFSQIINVQYTANMESELDRIAKGEAKKLDVLTPFYDGITNNIVSFNNSHKGEKPEDELVGRKCPDCGEELVYKVSAKGTRFIGCSSYPKCKHVEWINIVDKSVKCPDCETGYIVPKKYKDKKNEGKESIMYGCSSYPDCTHIMDVKKYKEIKSKSE
jgi:DNA topoisomerase I